MFPTDIVSCHPAAVPRVRFNSPDWVSIHVLHQPQPGLWLQKRELERVSIFHLYKSLPITSSSSLNGPPLVVGTSTPALL